MFTYKDVDVRSIFIINCIERKRSLRVYNGELLLEENEDSKSKTLTKFPFQKLFALFVIGHITVTTPIIEKFRKFGVALVVMKPNLRPVLYLSDSAEANFLLRKRQYEFSDDDMSVGKVLVLNKILNQKAALLRSRKKDSKTIDAIKLCENVLGTINDVNGYNELMGKEGAVSKSFFLLLIIRAWNGKVDILG